MDVLFGALGAIIFLFIVVPKGGAPPDEKKVVPVNIDEKSGKLFGDYLAVFEDLQVGDSLLVLATGKATFPSRKDCPPPVVCPECPECPECPKCPETKVENGNFKEPPVQSKPDLVYRPSVPSKFSIEIHWKETKNNVDLYVCKNGKCVFGKDSNRRNKDIGAWSSGKEMNTLGQYFKKSNLRTTMEAVRQIDELLPGSYSIQAVFKESEMNESGVEVTCLVYSERNNNPQVETFTRTISLNPGQKIQLGTVDVLPDGNFTLR